MDKWRDEMAGAVLRQARNFLCRWNDAHTRGEREDIAQDVALRAWRSTGAVRDRARFPAMVRTISRRVRWQTLQQRFGGRRIVFDSGVADVRAFASPAPQEDGICIRGQLVPKAWLLQQLDAALALIGRTNSQLLLQRYSGCTCVELAARHGLREEAVKMRLFRGRARLREEIEARARAAGYLEQ